MKYIFFTDQLVKKQITDSISENLTDWDLERMIIANVVTNYVEVSIVFFSLKFLLLKMFTDETIFSILKSNT